MEKEKNYPTSSGNLRCGNCDDFAPTQGDKYGRGKCNLTGATTAAHIKPGTVAGAKRENCHSNLRTK